MSGNRQAYQPQNHKANRKQGIVWHATHFFFNAFFCAILFACVLCRHQNITSQNKQQNNAVPALKLPSHGKANEEKGHSHHKERVLHQIAH